MTRFDQKREHPRGPVRAPVRYFEWDQAHDAIVSEIGSGGAFLETELPVAEGALLTLRISLPVGRSFTVLGRVVRTVRGSWARLRQSGMGIQFVDLGAEDRESLLSYVTKRPLLSA